ncbi:uncharacterized protein LOC122039725 [Zingiber officinale]|uniref:Uncharacterized protein n=1 Tax=Zingiber officinale TaxID=94328 RepID=A0A8J5HUZ3_ZINOF|nr:uncharacterized protein LOC122039725 [Zingiber officinale]KAG6527997.1 hypothetical protein ZIOFF_010134 [Zingiber officinale]
MHSSLDRRSDGCTSVGCFVFLRRPSSRSRFGYRPLQRADGFSDGEESGSAVRVVVGKERRVFLVEPFVLETDPLRVLMATAAREGRRRKGAVFVDVDHILFEHLVWLVHNEYSSAAATAAASSALIQLNLKEIIEFYSQEN